MKWSQDWQIIQQFDLSRGHVPSAEQGSVEQVRATFRQAGDVLLGTTIAIPDTEYYSEWAL